MTNDKVRVIHTLLSSPKKKPLVEPIVIVHTHIRAGYHGVRINVLRGEYKYAKALP